jgi:hypothetical protein
MADTQRDPVDPDAEGLPIDVALPDRASFGRGQAWAFMIVSLVGFVLLLLWWWWQPDQRFVLYLAMAVAAACVFNVARWLLNRRGSRRTLSRR